MPEAEPAEVGLRITAALDYARRSSNENLRPHYLWQLEKIAETVTLDDLTDAELVSLTSLLAPAHARLLSGLPTPEQAPTGRLLRIIPDAVS
jgi:hypothetical protein